MARTHKYGICDGGLEVRVRSRSITAMKGEGMASRAESKVSWATARRIGDENTREMHQFCILVDCHGEN
jgi:hypothetical protein